MVMVFIWLPKRRKSETDIGHGSMLIARGGNYVSNWPGSWYSIFYGKGQPAPDFSSDESSEGGSPQLMYRLDGLDEEAMVDRWTEMKKDLTYSFPTFNCFTTVAEVISAGIPGFVDGVLGDTFVPHSCVIAHALLVGYVHQVELAVSGHLAKNMLRPGSF
jgi:hypothetical protein